MVIPIPQPNAQPSFKFTEREDGLIAVEADTTEDHIAAFRKVTEELDEHFWAQGAVVASLTKKYGDKGPAIEALSEAVELSKGYLRQIARTYRTFQYVSRDTYLSFSHHKAACRHTKPEEALAWAKAGGKSKKELEAWVTEQSMRRASKATRKAHQAVRNTWREHLEHMDKIIVEDFIKKSPNQEYARRVCGEWRVELADELKQLEITENRELIIHAIDERGAEDEKAIRQATGIDRKEIGMIVARLVEENQYEWIPKRGEGEDARGTHSMILHKVGESDGGAFYVARPENRYAN